MNSIARNLLGNMRSCLCKSSHTFHPPQGFNTFLSAERCSSNFSIVIHKRGFFYQNKGSLLRPVDNVFKSNDFLFGRNTLINAPKLTSNSKCYCSSTKNNDEQKSPSLFQKFKALYKDYWYVVVPFHMATSAVWFGGFYYMAKSGVDIIPILEFLRVSDSIIDKFRSEHFEKAGYFAVAFAFYKLATPLRYACTLGGTTVAINYLKKWGFIKPIPSNQKLKEMCMEQKQVLIDRKNKLKENVIKNKLSLVEKKNRWNNRVHKAFKNVGLPEADSSKRAAKRNVSRTKKDSNGQKGSNKK
ncbi:hypothetical protein LSTR_LSTR004854 [Laodelphax striatellus]|uniref:DUF1279 domain-containing protein n=1 Tax=Laodelphax striatellus TaxID=195883 RepID=A0A482WI87_LAOST|nr:hypothetical protein LSTR_LSTR004854 [Laodelphax striatellus]